MNISPTIAKKSALELLRENRRGRSWRAIAHEDFKDQINHATLNRFANSKGEWLPKDKRLLVMLGLILPPRRKRIFDMSARELLWCLEHRQ